MVCLWLMSELNYIGIDREGRLVCAAAPTMPKRDLARELAKWVRDDLSIERCTDEYLKKHFGQVVGSDSGHSG